MLKFLIIPHEFAGFGAIIDRKIITTQLAKKFGRIPIFQNIGWPYEDPYEYEEFKIPSPTSTFNYTFQDDICVVFDTIDWINNFMEEGAKTRIMYDDGETLSSLKLKPNYETIIKNTLEKYPLISDSVSLHIRRGDKNDPSQELYPYYTSICDYVKACLLVCEKTGISNVYLNSDSFNALVETKTLLEKYGIYSFFDENELRYDTHNEINPNNKISAIQDKKISSQETNTGIKIIYTMSKSKHIVGMNNVQFTKLASYLLTYNSNCKYGYTWLDSKNKGKSLVYHFR